MIAATVVPLVRSEFWAVRVFDFPRLQITLVFLATFISYVLLREDPSRADDVFLVVLAACLAYQLWRMWPYTPLHRAQVKYAGQTDDRRGFSALISNVLHDNRDSERLLAQIRKCDPDVILLLETDHWWEEQLRVLESTHPHCLKQPQGNTYGMLFYSRNVLVDARVEFLVQDDVPSIHAGMKLPSGDQVELRCLHPRPPAPGESTRSTERDAELLIVAKELHGRNTPSIVMGDMNDVAWSRTTRQFQKISGLSDPRVGRGFFSTFNANWPFLRFPLDHAFISRHFQLAAFKVLPHVGSDHFPVFVRLSYVPSAAEPERGPPDPSAEDLKEASDKISRAG